MKRMDVFPIVTSAIKNAGYIYNKSLTYLIEYKYPSREPRREVNYYRIITRHYIT